MTKHDLADGALPDNIWPPPPNVVNRTVRRNYERVPGTLILTLAVIGIMVPLFSVLSLVLGFVALRRIDAGIGDPVHRNRVILARILALITIAIVIGYGTYRWLHGNSQHSQPLSRNNAQLQ